MRIEKCRECNLRPSTGFKVEPNGDITKYAGCLCHKEFGASENIAIGKWNRWAKREALKKDTSKLSSLQ